MLKVPFDCVEENALLKRLGVRLGLVSSLPQGVLQGLCSDRDRLAVLRIHNDGSHVLASLFVARHGAGSWGPDQLTTWLQPNDHVDVILSRANCLFDVRAVYHDRREQVVAEVDARVADVSLSY